MTCLPYIITYQDGKIYIKAEPKRGRRERITILTQPSKNFKNFIMYSKSISDLSDAERRCRVWEARRDSQGGARGGTPRCLRNFVKNK